ncbi:MAG: helix-turn-helix domain-containing protein [Pseudonocardiaceae bacterium]
MEWTPARIRLFRDVGLCLSQPQFAKKLGFASRTIGNAERGTHPPSLAVRRALDHALEQASEIQRNRFFAAVAVLPETCAAQDPKTRHGFAPPPVHRTPRRYEQRFETLVTSADDSAFGWFRTQCLRSTATRAVGMTDVLVIRKMTQTFRKLDNRFGGGRTRSAVINYLVSDVLPLLREGKYSDGVRRELFTAVAELDQVAGWTGYDMGDGDSGRRHLRRAMRLCQDVGDDALAGEMLAGMSHQAAFVHQPAIALDLARAAKDHGQRAGVPALVAEASVMEAHALALVKDVNGCLAALHESERAFAAAEERDRPNWLGYFDSAYLAAKFGRCFRDLGRPTEAERFARRSLDMTEGYERGKLFNLVLLASVLADQRKVEEACQTASAALCIAHDVQSVRITTDLADLSLRLAPLRADPAVRLLNEEMRAAGVLVQGA